MGNDFEMRLIEEGDVNDVLEIYKYYVDNTVISFEYVAPSLEEYRERIKTNTSKYPSLVCLYKNDIIGFAYGSTHRYRTAYQWSPESTIYIKHDFHARGIGSLLYHTLFDMLRLQGYFNVFAGVSLPNDKSIGFHKKSGFEEIGVFKKIGYKMGNWHDTQWFQLQLMPPVSNPDFPKSLKEVKDTPEFQMYLTTANQKLNQTD